MNNETSKQINQFIHTKHSYLLNKNLWPLINETIQSNYNCRCMLHFYLASFSRFMQHFYHYFYKRNSSRKTIPNVLEKVGLGKYVRLPSIFSILNYQYVINMDINVPEPESQQRLGQSGWAMGQIIGSRPVHTIATLQMLPRTAGKQPEMQSDLQQFKIEQVLHQTKDTMVVLVKETILQKFLITKTTKIPQIGSSLSRHLIYETQFYAKLNAVNVSHLAKINSFYLGQQECTRVMEFACRGDVSNYVSRAVGHGTGVADKMEHLRVVKNILWQVIKGVEQAHALGYVLRDIKPSNILINHNGKITLCDFGLVAPIGQIDTSICGTPEYMAPERLSKKRASTPINGAIDLWSIGIMAFQLLMGYTPYEYVQDDIDGLLEAIFEGHMAVDEELPTYCKKFVYNLLQTNPAKRMSIEKMKQHQFFKDFQQFPLLDLECQCRGRLG